MKKQSGFEGYYFRNVSADGEKIAAFIPCIAADGAFVQVITDSFSESYPVESLSVDKKRHLICADGCRFSPGGIEIALPGISGKISYSGITPLRYDIMGPFCLFPMECRHGVVSMRHTLSGSLCISGSDCDFSGGTGYIEKDSGSSFPSGYIWLQCASFADGGDSSVMLSVANIPLCGFHFTGCIFAAVHRGRQYRLATYLGAKADVGDGEILVRQGSFLLSVRFSPPENDLAFPLAAPERGNMSRTVRESNCVHAEFTLCERGKRIFALSGERTAYERHNMQSITQ